MTLIPDTLVESYALPAALGCGGALSYAGVPLRDESGHPVGVLLAVDDRCCEAALDGVALLRAAAERARRTAA